MSNLAAQPDAPSDAELISRVRAGDQAAYGQLFERHREAAHRMARQLVRGPDIDDLISEAFTKVFVQLQRGGGPDVAFRAYLLTAIRRLHVDRARTNQRVQVTDDLEDLDRGVDFVDPATSSFERGAASRAFASLPERWQLVLWHLEVEGQKPADIAPLLGMSPNSVAALAYRAREGLRQAYLQSHLADTADEGCRWTTEHLGAYVRKGLAKRDSTKVENHLEGCHRCTAVYLELTEVNSNLSGLLAPALLGLAAPGYLAAGGTKLGLLLLWPWTKLKEAGAAAQAGAAAAAVTAIVAVAAVAGVFGGGDDDAKEAVEPSTQQTAPDSDDSSPENNSSPDSNNSPKSNNSPDSNNSNNSPDSNTQPDQSEPAPDEEPPPDEEDPPENDDPPDNDPPPDQVPDTPTDVSGNLRGSHVVLRWDPVDDARGYRVYREASPASAPTGVTAATPASSPVSASYAVPASYSAPAAAYVVAEPGNGPVVSDGVIEETSFRDNSLVDGNEYRYVVTSVARGEESPVSQPVTAVYNPVPDAPAQVRTGERGRGVIVGWKANAEPDIDEYRILRDGKEVGTSTSPRFIDGSAVDGSTYEYEVVAVDRSGQKSAESRSVSGTFDPAPAAPNGLAIEERGTNLTLTWDKNAEPDIDGYRIYRDGQRIGVSDTARYVDNDAPGGKSRYVVTAIDGSGQESPESDGATSDPAPDAPTGVEASAVDDGIEVTWDSNDESDLQGYRIYRDDELIGRTANQHFTDDTVTERAPVDGETYTYTVTAVDDSRQESRESRPATATYDPTPDAPTGLEAEEAFGGTVKLHWAPNEEPDLTGYRIYRDGTPITTVGRTTTHYIDAPATHGCVTYTIRAVDASGVSTPSEPERACPGPPAAPTDFSWEVEEDVLHLRWASNAEDDFRYYKVWLDGQYQGIRHDPYFQDGGHVGTYHHRLRVAAYDEAGHGAETVFRFTHHERRVPDVRLRVDIDDRRQTTKPPGRNQLQGFGLR